MNDPAGRCSLLAVGTTEASVDIRGGSGTAEGQVENVGGVAEVAYDGEMSCQEGRLASLYKIGSGFSVV